jgi:ribosomal RNA-processing protein 7
MEEARSDRLKNLRSEPDEDGFVTVTRGGRNQPVKLEAAQAIAVRAKERQEKKKVGTGFYRFEAREEAKRKERELKEKFEQDAWRVSEMRKRRGRIMPE